MNNKKLSRLLEPNLKLYFFCLAVFALAAVPASPVLALVEGVATVGLYVYFTQGNKKRRQGILQYIDTVTGSVDTASKSTLINSPLPIMVFRPDTGEVIWSNENFQQLAGVREHLFEMKVEDAVPVFPVQWLLEGKQECPDRVFMNNRRFRVYGSLVRAKGRGGEQNLVATTYWVDTTEADALRETYTATRPVLAILMKFLKKPLSALGQKLGLDFMSTSAMIFSLANSVSLFVMMKDMKRRGIIIATAWMVTASAVLGDHLGFTASVAQEMILPLVVTKVTGGIVAVALGLYLTRKLPETDA